VEVVVRREVVVQREVVVRREVAVVVHSSARSVVEVVVRKQGEQAG
jgi:hypothetical protein